MEQRSKVQDYGTESLVRRQYRKHRPYAKKRPVIFDQTCELEFEILLVKNVHPRYPRIKLFNFIR